MKTSLLLFIIFSHFIVFTVPIPANDQQLLAPNQPNYHINNIIKRNNKIYTQGLLLTSDAQYLFESGGLYQESTMTKMKFPSFEVVAHHDLPKNYFGEGIAKCNDVIYQLTWREGKMLLYTYPEMKYIHTAEKPKEIREGWGMTQGKKEDEVYITDGSEYIYSYKCDKNNQLLFTGKTKVESNCKAIEKLNDLVYVNGFIYVNIYTSSKIAKVNPENGQVITWYEMSPLVQYEIKKNTLTENDLYSGNVLNGITYNEVNKTFLITGKEWGYFYEVELN